MRGPVDNQLSAFVTEKVLEILKGRLFVTEGFEALRPTNKYEVLRGRFDDSLVIMYSSGKVVYERSERIRRVIEEAVYETTKEDGTVLGSDEAGKGELIGPLAVAAVCLTPRQAARLVSWGVADSKVVPAGRIRELADLIMSESLGYKVLSIPPLRFNQLYERTTSEGKNLNDILADAHSEVIKSVLGSVSATAIRIVVDQFDASKTGRRLKVIEGVSKGRRVESKPRAETMPAVAAASVLARREYMHWVEENLDDRQLAELEKGRVDIAETENDVARLYKMSYLRTLGMSRARKAGKGTLRKR